MTQPCYVSSIFNHKHYPFFTHYFQTCVTSVFSSFCVWKKLPTNRGMNIKMLNRKVPMRIKSMYIYVYILNSKGKKIVRDVELHYIAWIMYKYLRQRHWFWWNHAWLFFDLGLRNDRPECRTVHMITDYRVFFSSLTYQSFILGTSRVRDCRLRTQNGVVEGQ